jgi:hypothetical protein
MPCAISGRPAGWRGLFDIVRWDYRERFGDASQFAARSSVLILRSARAVEVPQIRASVRASRRMRRGSRKPGLRLFPVFVLSGPVMDDNPGRPTRRRSRVFPVAILELTGKPPASGCTRPPVFLLLFTGKQGHRMGRGRKRDP